jgi:hypothetical protein
VHLKNRGKSPPFAHKNNTVKDMYLGLPKKLHYVKQMQTQEFVSRLVLVMVCLFNFGDSNLG